MGIELSTHIGGHLTTAKHAKCKWCSWQSDAYDPQNTYARDRAFEAQKSHANKLHAGKMRALKKWLDESGKA